MNLCLTPRSIKLLGTYFKKELTAIVDNNKSYDDIQKELFDKALLDFQTDDKVRDKELIIQHLTILPQVLHQHLTETFIDNPKLSNIVNSLRSTIYNATQIKSADEFQQIIDEITRTLGIGSLVITEPAQVPFNAIAFNFGKTASQGAIWNALTGYSNNIDDPKKQFEIKTIQNIIEGQNPNNYQFKLITVKEAQINPLISYEYDMSDSTQPLLIVVDKKGNPVLFDEGGKPSPSGRIPGIPIKTTRAELDYNIQEQIKIYSQTDMSVEDAEKFVNASVNSYLGMIGRSIEKMNRGEAALFDMNMADSSIGFTELNNSIQTPLNSVKNVDELEVSIYQLKEQRKPRINIPNAKNSADVYNRPLDSLSESVINNLIELFTNPNLTIEGTALSISKRQQLITTYIQFKGVKASTNGFGFAIRLNSEGTQISTVVLGDIVYSVNSKDFKDTFRKYISEFKGFPFTGNIPNNYKIVEGIENVTFQNQVYLDNGVAMIARKPEISFGLYSGVNIGDLVTIIQKIEDNSITTVQQSRADYIKENGYTVIVPNGDGQIRGYSPYISFISVEDRTSIAPSEDHFFSSVSEVNSKTKATESEETEADKWWSSNPLSSGIKLSISDQVHVKGEAYVAEFVRNSILLFKGSDKTEIYHEAFHGFTQSILTAAERKVLYDSVRKMNGTANVVVYGKNKTITFKDASDLEIEEYLASEFKLYALWKGKGKGKSKHTKTSIIGKFFEKVLEALKKFFGNHTANEVNYLNKFSPEVKAIFKDLYNGNVDMSKFEAPSGTVSHYSTFEASEKIGLSYQEMNLTMNSMRGLMSHFITTALNATSDPKKTLEIVNMLTEISSLSPQDKDFDQKRKEVNDKINAFERELGPKNGLGLLRLSSNPKTMGSALLYIKQILEQKRISYSTKDDIIAKENVAMLDKVLENFGDPKADIRTFKNDNTTIIGVYLNNHSKIKFNTKFEDDFAWSDENIEDNFRLIFDRTGAEQIVADAADDITKEILSGIPSYENNGRGERKLNRLGLPELLPFNVAIGKVVKVVGNKVDLDDIYNALLKAASIDKEMRAILNILGDVGNTTAEEQQQWTAVWGSIAKATNNLRFISLTKTDNEEDNEVAYTSFSGRSKQNLRVIAAQWRDNFKFESEINNDFYVSNEDKGNERYLDAENFGIYVESEYTTPVYIPIDGFDVLYHEKRFTNVKYSEKVKKYDADPFSLLKLIGISFPETHEIRELFMKGSPELGIEPGVLHYIVESIINRANAKYDTDRKIYNLQDLFKPFAYRVMKSNRMEDAYQPDVTGYYVRLQQIAQALSDEHVNFSGRNAKGDIVSEKTKHSSLTVTVNTLNNASSYDELLDIPGMEGFNYLTNPYVVGSTWFVQMFNLHKPTTDKAFGKRNKDISIVTEVLSGTQIIYNGVDKGVASIDSDELTKFISDFHLTLDGGQEILRSEAKSTSAVVYPTNHVDSDGRLRKGLVVNNVEVQSIYADDYDSSPSSDTLLLYNQVIGNLEAELIRINRINAIKQRIENGETVKFDAKYLERGSEFVFFKSLLSDTLKAKLKSLKVVDSFTLNNMLSFAEKKQIEKSLKDYFEYRSDQLFDEKQHQLILADKFNKNKLKEEETEDQVKKRLVKVFVINNFINNMNYASLFLGDPAIYDIPGDAYHKRISAFISTGDIFRFDNSWYNYVNSNSFEARGFAKKHSQTSGVPYVNKSYDGHLNTGVIKESVHDSAYKKHYAEVAGISEEDYEKMEEADGAGWISFDTYRLLAKSSNDWSDNQERLYQAILRGDKINPLIMTATFPIKKYQFSGDVSNEDNDNYGLQPKGFHKYSLAPIIPGLHDGTPLQALHEKMMKEGMDYVTMSTGSKLSTIITIDKGLKDSTADDIYTKEREISDVPFTVNKIHVRGLKNQVKMAEGYKGYITLPTQFRSMILLGVMDASKGTPLDYTGTKKQWDSLSESKKQKSSKNYKWLIEYETILNNMQVLLKEELLTDIGMTEVITKEGVEYKGDTKLLAKYIQSQMLNEDLLPEEIQFILTEDGNLIDDLSLSLLSEKIEKIVTVMVDKKLRRIKVNGEALVQMSGVMTESSQFKAPTEADLTQYGTNGLKTYYLKDENGDLVTKVDKNGVDQYVVSKMEVKISLQGDFKNLLYLNHIDGKPMNVYIKENGKKTLDFDASLKRLNESIANAEWNKKHEKFLTLSGPRIPTQQENTLEAAVVKEFLNPMAGNLIIVPSEMVAKAGSDFDIDKLFLMFPNIININGTIKLQEHADVKESYDDLYADLEAYNIVLNQEYKKRDDIRSERSDAWEEVREIRQEVKRLNADFYDLLDDTKTERDLLIKEASDAYNKTGKYVDISREEQKSIHKETSKDIQELTNTIDTIYEAIDQAFEDILATRSDLGTLESIKDKFKLELEAVDKEISKLKEGRGVIQEKIHQKGIGGLENALLNSFVERITMGNNFPNLVKANSTDIFEGGDVSLVEQADSFVNKAYNKYDVPNGSPEKTISGTTVLDYRFNLLKHQENSVGLDALGIAAVAATYYALFSRMGATLNSTSPKEVAAYKEALDVLNNPKLIGKPHDAANKVIEKFSNYTLKFKHNSVKDALGNHIALGFLKNVDNLSISEIIGQLINGYVDVAKNPWIFKIQGNKQNTPQLLFMSMAGMSVKDIVFFTSMPLVVEYNRIKAEMSGVFSNLNNNVGEDPIVSTSNVANRARQEMFNRHKDLFKEVKRTFQPSDYKQISNLIDSELNWESLEALGKQSKRSFEEFKILTHYFEIEDMGNDMTDFQRVTKFDTQTMNNVSDVQSRIEETESLKGKTKAFPNTWFTDFAKTSRGLFNADRFRIALFANRFAIRNNPIVVKASISIKTPKGSIKTVVQSSYKNEFLSFLYQNFIYEQGLYSGYKLEESKDASSMLQIDEENKTVTYGKAYMEHEKNEVSNLLEGPNRDRNNNHYFPTDGHFLRFKIELEKLETEVEEMSDSQILEHLDYANSYSTGTGTPIGVMYKAALYRSDNNVAMFDYRMGRASILKKLVLNNPELRDQYRLISDMRFNSQSDIRKENMYLPNIKDPEAARIYRENLRMLKNHHVPEVADFFNKFDHMVIMQSGVNVASQYNMAKIINQGIFSDVIDKGIDLVLRDLRNVQLARSQGQAAESIYLSAFNNLFNPILEDANKYRLRVRGVNYMVDTLGKGVDTAVTSSMSYNNTSIVNNFNDIPEGITELEVDHLYDEVNGGFNNNYISELKGTPIYIMNLKLVAPEGESQIELDILLKEVFGILNGGRTPAVIAMSKGQEGNNISIATAQGLKLQYAHIDETMANESNVAIGKPTIGNPLYKSSSQIYVDEINRNYPERLAGDKTSFKPTDKVWVFGSGVFPNAYKGVTGGKEEFENMIKDTFETHHLPLINKAIGAGVNSFYVGNASGIDALVRTALTEKGYTSVVRYTSTGKYFEFVKDVDNALSDLYVVSKPSTSIYDMGLGYLFNKEFAAEINSMKAEEVLTSSPYEIVKADVIAKTLTRFPDAQSRKENFYKVLSENPGAITVGESNYSSLVEKILMETRSLFDAKEREKQLRQSIPINQKETTQQAQEDSNSDDWTTNDNESENPLKC